MGPAHAVIVCATNSFYVLLPSSGRTKGVKEVVETSFTWISVSQHR